LPIPEHQCFKHVKLQTGCKPAPAKIQVDNSGYKFYINTCRDYFIGVIAVIRSIISVPESAEIFHDIELNCCLFLFTTLSLVFTLILVRWYFINYRQLLAKLQHQFVDILYSPDLLQF